MLSAGSPTATAREAQTCSIRRSLRRPSRSTRTPVETLSTQSRYSTPVATVSLATLSQSQVSHLWLVVLGLGLGLGLVLGLGLGLVLVIWRSLGAMSGVSRRTSRMVTRLHRTQGTPEPPTIPGRFISAGSGFGARVLLRSAPTPSTQSRRSVAPRRGRHRSAPSCECDKMKLCWRTICSRSSRRSWGAAASPMSSRSSG